MGARDFTIADVISRNAEMFSDQAAFVCGERSTTHRAYRDRVAAIAAGLAHAGVSRGDRIAVLARNGIEFAELIGAAAFAGAVLVPLNWRLSDGELAFMLEDSRPSHLVADAGQQERALALLGETRPRLIGIGACADGFAPFEELARQGTPAAGDVAHADDPFIMLYTAATDGQAKGALISHAGLLAGSAEPLRIWAVGPDDVNLGVLPLFHLAGLMMALVTQRAGGSSVLFPDFDPGETARAARLRRGSLLAEFPPILESVLDATGPDDLSHLRVVIGLDTPQTIERLGREWPDAEFWSVFGQSETSGFVTLSRYRERPGAAGQPVASAHVRVVDEEDRPLPTGRTGEIVVRSPGVFLGYWGRGGDTEFTLRGGWHHTGDLGAFDEDGYLWYKGRTAAKELIKSGGENVYPAEVEQTIAAHEAIAEVSVIGVPDSLRGETVKAVCVLRPGFSLTGDQLSDYVGERIARFKRPRRVEFVAALPKRADGGVDRARVKELHGDG